jgi:hypothetical protein
MRFQNSRSFSNLHVVWQHTTYMLNVLATVALEWFHERTKPEWTKR